MVEEDLPLMVEGVADPPLITDHRHTPTTGSNLQEISLTKARMNPLDTQCQGNLLRATEPRETLLHDTEPQENRLRDTSPKTSTLSRGRRRKGLHCREKCHRSVTRGEIDRISIQGQAKSEDIK